MSDKQLNIVFFHEITSWHWSNVELTFIAFFFFRSMAQYNKLSWSILFLNFDDKTCLQWTESVINNVKCKIEKHIGKCKFYSVKRYVNLNLAFDMDEFTLWKRLAMKFILWVSWRQPLYQNKLHHKTGVLFIELEEIIIFAFISLKL